MKIILDVMGGDNSPAEFIKGAVAAKNEYNIDIILVGDKSIIEKAAEESSLSLDNIEIVHTDTVINMEDPALSVVREKNDSSMATGLKMLRDGKGDALVSAGNTGALHAGSTLIVRRIKGIHRSAIATILVLQNPMVLIDSGANISVVQEDLMQFGFMGAVYMSKLFGLQSPRVGLLNNGSEATKGTPLLVDTYQKMSENTDINFVGNIEGKDIPYGKCDVLVTDGFTGNIVLKLCEGLSGFLMKKIKGLFLENMITKLSALGIRKSINNMKKEFDATEYGGAPLLGISKPVIKAHGNSNANAVKNALRQAKKFAESGVIKEIAMKLNSASEVEAENAKNAASEDGEKE